MHRVTLAAAVLAAAMGPMAAARSSPGNLSLAPDAAPAGAHAFDSLAGRWTAHHRRLKDRLAGSQEWEEFAGTMDCRLLMGGSVVARDSRYEAPGGTQRGVGLSSYDAKTDQWTAARPGRPIGSWISSGHRRTSRRIVHKPCKTEIQPACTISIFSSAAGRPITAC
jgi:hypothetical protein